jgi:F-type H+-transporting ATPase subunit gamma
MKRESDLKRRLRSLETLGDAIGAMKSLAAHHFRETRHAVEPARAYRAGIERILSLTGAELPAGTGPAGLLVVGGELGLCGSYNARLVSVAAERRRTLGPGPTICVGHRTASLLARQRVELHLTFGAPTSVRGIPASLMRVAEETLTIYVGQELSSLDVVSARFGGVGAETPVATQLLPFPASGERASNAPQSPPRTPPAREKSRPTMRYAPSRHFESVAAREFLYIALYDIFLDALASEHGARLVATQSAESWLDERARRLGRRLAAARRENSTQEMIEISSGARARRW